MRHVHPSAVIDPQVALADDVTVGPYCVLRGHVTLGPGCVVHEHSVVHGNTVVGRDCRIGPGAFVGLDPQHTGFRADPANPTWLVIGDGVVIREAARLNRATRPGVQHATRLGNRCYVMGGAHVAHDCVLGDGVILADSALLGGHCRVGENAFLGGGCTIHQHVTIGRLAIIGGNEAFTHDVPPFAAVRYGRLKGYNAIGCKRAGMSHAASAAIRAAYLRLRTQRTTPASLAAIAAEVPDFPEVRELVQFIVNSRRGIMPSKRDPARGGSRPSRRRGEPREELGTLPAGEAWDEG